MNSSLRQLLLKEAIRIGDDLLSKAEIEPPGILWRSVEVQGEEMNWNKSENIYQGVCGLVLFFIQLYKQTAEERYLQAVLEGMQWAERYSTASAGGTNAFLTGRMSVPFTYLQVYELTGQKLYLQKALELTRKWLQDPPPALKEYINGTAGTLLCLVHLHAASGEKWLLEHINQYAGLLLDHCYLGKQGLYWDRSPVNIHGLCGLSHGASGVGFVWLELGNYFTNPAFYWLAEQAFAYESQYYHTQLHNWCDLRKILSFAQEEPAMRKAYEKGERSYFTQGASMNAWCHGAAGIGLVRLRAYEVLGKYLYLEEARLALEHTRLTDIQAHQLCSPTLCHGSAGNAELFLKAYEVTYEPAYLEMALKIAEQILQWKKDKGMYCSGTRYAGEDTSLFLGNAGIGYFFLRLLEPQNVPSILLPSLPVHTYTHKSGYATLSMSVGDIQERILNKHFPRTLFLLTNFCPAEKEVYFKQQSAISSTPVVLHFTEWINTQITQLLPVEQNILREVWQLEEKKLERNTNISSDVLWYYKSQLKAQRAILLEALPDAALANTRLMLDPDMQLTSVKLPGSWQHPATWLKDDAYEATTQYLLLMPSLDFTREQALSDFTYTVLAAFIEEIKVSQGIELVLMHLDGLADKQIPEVWQLILSQIRHAIRSGILLEPDRHPLPVISRSALAIT
ncbi:lanthionine synthetase LanC family protein [Rhodocytophaga aerolata]|uniref:Lanthionine synthetase LanC family protein n=1 Tax=Rhodocytophaga aerolata TaxID=455078 RepID=A0ABT8R7S3_9BACT|nr:lanthionine synthetase LanC family protein [Rhodocytophaga aerolata]MDO1446725.1 lanthionine synthetase LanC family protein [Rhodocytophaga aerolata]